MRLSGKTRLVGAQRRASRARTLANPSSKLNRATTGEAGPTRGPGSAAEPQRELPASRAQRESHANRARLRLEKQSREAALGNDGDLAQGGSEHDRADSLLSSFTDFPRPYVPIPPRSPSPGFSPSPLPLRLDQLATFFRF